MSRQRARTKGRTSDGQFAGIPKECMDHPGYIELTYKAKVLLFEFARQYNGFNNGDLVLTWKLLKPRGWSSKRTIQKARDELQQSGWIVTTRPGARNQCQLYAVTYKPIDECKGKHDAAPTRTPLAFWRQRSNPWLIDSKAA